MTPYTRWEVVIDTGHAGVERAMQALLMTRSNLVLSCLMSHKTGHGIDAVLLVDIPIGSEPDFDRECRHIGRQAPTKAGF